MLKDHCARISRPGGLFEDTALTGTVWRGQVRRVRAVLYRRLNPRGRVPSALEVEAELNDVATKWIGGARRGRDPRAAWFRGRPLSLAAALVQPTRRLCARRRSGASSGQPRLTRGTKTCRSARTSGRC